MEEVHFLSLSDDLRIDQITITLSGLVIHVISTPPICCCPLCGQTSDQIHSRYLRVVADVPCGNRPVSLHLEVGKFFCRSANCPRKIFTERLPELLQPSARVTNRLRSALQALGLATGGEVGARLASKLGMQAAPTTFLRYLRAMSSCPSPKVRVLGLDDWAYKRGYKYGTMLVDLERHQVIDLLPDREKETVQAWLRAHPEIEVISRDRAGTYAEAARAGAPQALQVADRFHLIKNVREKLQELLERKRTCLPRVKRKERAVPAANGLLLVEEAEQTSSDGFCPQEEHMALESHVAQFQAGSSCVRLSADERRKQLSRDKRYARYEEVKALREYGMSHDAIADALGISRPTVRRFLSAEQFPEQSARSRTRHRSKVTAYLPFVRQRWQAGCHNGHQLFREIKAQGYSGSLAQFGRVITQWRKELPSAQAKSKKSRGTPSPAAQAPQISAQHGSFLLVATSAKLTEEQQQEVEQMCQASDELATAYVLSQAFVTMLKERKVDALDDWLKQVDDSQVKELKSLAKGIRRDYAAVRAACSQSWSNGQVEGQINRLKCTKRQMYGRAQFDLLRLRVLHAA